MATHEILQHDVEHKNHATHCTQCGHLPLFMSSKILLSPASVTAVTKLRHPTFALLVSIKYVHGVKHRKGFFTVLELMCFAVANNIERHAEASCSCYVIPTYLEIRGLCVQSRFFLQFFMVLGAQ